MLTPEKHFWLSGQWAAPAITETTIAKEFPSVYYEKPKRPAELRSYVEGATITRIAATFPHQLIKKGKAKELTSKWE